MVMQPGGFGNSPFNQALVDINVTKSTPGVSLYGLEPSGGYSDIREINGALWLTTNTVWNAALNGYTLRDNTQIATAIVIQPGQQPQYALAGLGNTPIDWEFFAFGSTLVVLSLGLVSVKDPNVYNGITYQAVGNGVADDTVALQGIMTNLAAGQVMYFPPGTYKTTAPLLFNQPIAILGYSQDAVTINSFANDFALKTTGIVGLTVTGITIRNNSNYGCFGAYGKNSIINDVVQQNYQYCGTFTFRDVKFYANLGDAVLLSNVNSALFDHCSWSVASRCNGIHLTGAGFAAGGGPQNGINLGYSSGITFSNCDMSGSGATTDTSSCGIFMDGYASQVILNNSRITSFGYNIGMFPKTQTATYVDSGNVTHTYSFPGKSSNVFIDNNIFIISQSHNLIGQPQDTNSSILNVNIDTSQFVNADVNAGSFGMLWDAYTNGGVINGVMISNTIVAGCAQHGVVLYGVYNLNYTGGAIVATQQIGAVGSGYAIFISNAACQNITFTGVNCANNYNSAFPSPVASAGLYVGVQAHLNLVFRDCDFADSLYVALTNNLPTPERKTGNLIIYNCNGINPIGGPNPPLNLDTQTNNYYNVYPADLRVFVSGGLSAGTIFVGSVDTGLTSGMFYLEPGEYINLQASGSTFIRGSVG